MVFLPYDRRTYHFYALSQVGAVTASHAFALSAKRTDYRRYAESYQTRERSFYSIYSFVAVTAGHRYTFRLHIFYFHYPSFINYTDFYV